MSQPLLSDFASTPVAFHDVSAIFAGGAAASLASAESIGMWTNDVPGANGSYVQEAYGAIHPAYDSVRVVEDDYWALSHNSALTSGRTTKATRPVAMSNRMKKKRVPAWFTMGTGVSRTREKREQA